MNTYWHKETGTYQFWPENDSDKPEEINPKLIPTPKPKVKDNTVNKIQLLNQMLSEGATHFTESPDGAILFMRPSKFITDHYGYKWQYLINGEYQNNTGWLLSTGSLDNKTKIKDFITS